MLLCASFLVIGVVYGEYSATQLNEVFADYKKRFGHNFGVDEAYRKKVFHDNLLYINDSNSKGLPYTLGITPFTHLTNAEFKELMTIKFPREKLTSRHSGNAGKAFKKSTEDLPKSIDYVKKGFVTKVKNQGNCGSCWAFSTTGALEGAYMKATGKLVSLSEQQMVDCSSDYGNYGCSGGDQYPTLQYVGASGLESEKDYPYIEGEGNCTHNPSKNIIKSCAVKPYRVPANSSTDLLKALVENGPISISIDGGSNVFQSYTGGVIDRKCGTNINHAVLLVGYDMTAPKPYYLVKNSWGTEWGEKGYVKIAIDKSKEGVCGILSDSSYPSIHL